jgi:hypothetical protein
MPRVKLRLLAFLATVGIAAACGARTGLGVPNPPEAEGGQGGQGGSDAGNDTAPDVPVDVPVDVPIDVPADVPVDVPPPICDDAGVTFIYMVSAVGELYSYYPPSGSLTDIGPITCPGAQAYSMAVDRAGTAYVEDGSGDLYTVDTRNANCSTTPFATGQAGVVTFGMGFSADVTDPGETLFVAGDDQSNAPTGLASIDLTSWVLTPIGQWSMPIGSPELTGTGDGQLYAFGVNAPGVCGSYLARIDKTNADVLESVLLPIGQNVDGWAFAYWGGDFYFFTSPNGGPTTISQYVPPPGQLTGGQLNDDYATLEGVEIVGAGVSTCAPM